MQNAGQTICHENGNLGSINTILALLMLRASPPGHILSTKIPIMSKVRYFQNHGTES